MDPVQHHWTIHDITRTTIWIPHTITDKKKSKTFPIFCSLRLPLLKASTSTVHVNAWITTHLPTPVGMEGWVGNL